jgi:hypothetical protein
MVPIPTVLRVDLPAEANAVSLISGRGICWLIRMDRGRRYSIVEILFALTLIALLAYLALPAVWQKMVEIVNSLL